LSGAPKTRGAARGDSNKIKSQSRSSTSLLLAELGIVLFFRASHSSSVGVSIFKLSQAFRCTMKVLQAPGARRSSEEESLDWLGMIEAGEAERRRRTVGMY